MWLINLLDFVGSGMVVGGLVWGGVKLIATRSRLEEEREAAQQIQQESSAAYQRGEKYDSKAEQRKRGVRPGLTMAATAHLQQDVELMIVNYLRPQLKGPFVVAAVGTLFSFLRALLVICGVGS